MKIAIVEDDQALLAALTAGMKESNDVEEVLAFADAESALAAIPDIPVDVILMDINLPGMSGVDCVRELIRRDSQAKILMHTVFEDTDEVFSALRAGALSYILKRTPFPELMAAVRATNAGETAMTPRIARHVVRYFQTAKGTSPATVDAHEAPKERLTDREHQTLSLVAKGFQNKEVARELEISADTVRVHLRNIFHKWQVNNRTQAVAAFLKLPEQ